MSDPRDLYESLGAPPRSASKVPDLQGGRLGPQNIPKPPVRIAWSEVAPRMLLNMQQHEREYKTRNDILEELKRDGQIDADEEMLVQSILRNRKNMVPVSAWMQTLFREVPYRLRHLIFVLAWCDAVVAVGTAVEFSVRGHGGRSANGEVHSPLTTESITSMLYQMEWPDFREPTGDVLDGG